MTACDTDSDDVTDDGASDGGAAPVCASFNDEG